MSASNLTRMALAAMVHIRDDWGSSTVTVRHLKTPLMVVLGHERCGAIQAALQVKYERVPQLSRIQLLVDNILPALAGLDPHLPPAAQLAQAVERTVRWTVRTIIESPEGHARAVEGRVKCVGAIYEIETGLVRFLEPLVGRGAGAVWETAAKGTG